VGDDNIDDTTTGGGGGGGGGGDPGGGTGGDEGGGAPAGPTVGGHLVAGPVGFVTVDPAPGVFDDAAGTGPLRAEVYPGGTMPANAWSLNPTTGAVTLDATKVGVGTYNGAFVVVDASEQETPPAPIIFIVEPIDRLAVEDLPPETSPDTVRLEPGNRVFFSGPDNVLDNDWDDDALTARRMPGGTLPASLATLNADGTFVVDATTLAEGTYTFYYRAEAPDFQGSAPEVVTVIVDNNNACPVARSNTWSIRAGAVFRVPASLGVLANDTDAEGDALHAELIGTFAKTDIAMGTDGSVYLDARKAKSGTFRQFSYYAVDPKGEKCAPATVRLTIVPNLPPVANENFFTVGAGTTFTVPARGVLGNDLDPDGAEDRLTARMSRSLPGLTLRSDGSFTYKVPKSAGSRLVARYVAVDDLGASSAPADIIFRIVPAAQAPPPNHPPTAAPDRFYRVHADEILDVSAADGVLANDADPDGDALFAEPVATSDETRFPLLRDGSFVFKPTMDDIGTTFTFSYYAVERGYTAARTPNTLVSVQVVAPRERCKVQTAEILNPLMNEDGAEVENLATASARFGFCYDLRRITQTGFFKDGEGFLDDGRSVKTPGRAQDGLEYDVSGSVDAVASIIPGLEIQGSGGDRASVLLYTGSENAQLLLRPEYRVCVNPLLIVLDLVLKFKKLEKIPYVGKWLRQEVDDLGVAWLRVVDSVRAAGGKFVAVLDDYLLEALKDPGIKKLLKLVSMSAANDVLTSMASVFSIISPIAVDVKAPDKGDAVVKMAWGQIYSRLIDDDTNNDVTVLSAITCLPVGELTSALGNADASWYARLVKNGSIISQGEPDGNDGAFDMMGDLVQAFDLLENGEVEPDWTYNLTDGVGAVVGCNLTRVRPNQQPVPGDSLPGLPARACP
jgi:hypothetical protein